MRKTLASKLFLNAILLLGAASLARALALLSVPEPVRFACYCLLTLATAAVKIQVPGLSGTLTLNYLFVLIGLADLSLPQCLIAGTAAAALQCLVQSKARPHAVQVIFNAASCAAAIAACGTVFYSPWLLSQGIGLLMRLTFAATVYFAVNTFAVTAMISLTESKPLLRLWKECYLWVFPFYFIGAGLAWGFHWFATRFGWQFAMLAVPGIHILYASYHFYLGRLQHDKENAQDLAALHLRTIEALALAIDAKDHTTHDHLKRVQVYATEIARQMDLTDSDMKALQAAVMLHDIGKLAVPEHIVSKPGKLTPEEFEKMKIHPVVGAEILDRVQFPYPVAEVVRSHHERWDGAGYPEGLSGEDIPIGARILAVVDCMDALAADRKYRKAVPLDRAMEMIVEQAGHAFDPKVVAVLQNCYQELEARTKSDRAVGLSAQPFGATSMDSEASPTIGFLASIAAARQEVQTLFELSDDLGQSISESSTLSSFASKLKLMVPYDQLCVYALRQEILVPNYVTGGEQVFFSELRIPLGQGLSGWVAENNFPVVNGNPAVEPGYLNDPEMITGLKSALAIPVCEDGSVVGVLSLYSRERSAFNRDHLRVLQALAPRLGTVLSIGLRLSEAQDNAVTDYLTGLPNSRSLYLHLEEEMARCRRRSARLGVFLCDLDGFKRINDEHGHMEGSCVLKAIAEALRECCRGYDYVARMGGDEFVVLAPDIEENAVDEHVRRFQFAVELTGKRLGHAGLSASFGAVVFPADGDLDGDALLAEADRRMYANKRRTKAIAAALMDPAAAAKRKSEKAVQGHLDLIALNGPEAQEPARIS